MADLERDYDYKEEHFDFIQVSVLYKKTIFVTDKRWSKLEIFLASFSSFV